MEEAKLAILTDAKNEYSLQLVNVLKSSICNGLQFLYIEGKKKCIEENRFNEVLSEFQEFLSQIRLWSQSMIENEYKRIEDESGCDFIKELIIAVFMSHTQILQSIHSIEQSKQKSNQLDIPKAEHFIHKCYINAGREFYKNPFFFYDGPEISPIEKQRNILQCEQIIANSISETIRQLLPVRRILKSYLQENYNPEQYQEEERNNLRDIVKKEISNYNTNKTSSDSSIRNLIEEEFKNTPSLSSLSLNDNNNNSSNQNVSSLSNTDTNTSVLDNDETKKKVLECLEVPVVPSIQLIQETDEKTEEESKPITEININDIETKDDIFETIPELSLDEIEMIIKNQEEEEQAEEELEKQAKELAKLNETNQNSLPNLDLSIDFEEVKIENKEKVVEAVEEAEAVVLEQEIIKEIKNESEIKTVIVENEPILTKKAKQELKNAEIIVEKKEIASPLVHPVSLNPLIVLESLKPLEPLESKDKPILVQEEPIKSNKEELNSYDPSLEFDEEINLLDDIIFEQPKKQTQSNIPLTSKKYTFF